MTDTTEISEAIKVKGTTVEILGKVYQVKCDEKEIHLLRQAAEMLEEQMLTIRQSGTIISVDRLAVVSALNITHQLILLQQEKANLEAQLIANNNKLNHLLALLGEKATAN